MTAPREVVLGLGSNLGDRLATLRRAVQALDAEGLHVLATSRVYETDPVGGPAQPHYLNAVAVVRTALPLSHVLAIAIEVEAAYGRTREVRWGPRTLDIDVVAAGAETSDDPDCTVPHPRAHERAFVLQPWRDVQPDAVVPGRGTVRELADRVGTEGVQLRPDLVLPLPRPAAP